MIFLLLLFGSQILSTLVFLQQLYKKVVIVFNLHLTYKHSTPLLHPLPLATGKCGILRKPWEKENTRKWYSFTQ